MHIEPTADVDPTAVLGAGTQVWHLAQVREHAQLGDGCVLGRGAYIGPGVVIGRNCKIQNYALVYEPALLEDGVFVGPGAVLTNDLAPRAVNPDGSRKSAEDWTAVAVHIGTGASIGAHAVCVAPVRIGRWALVAAGAVVTRDVADFAIVAGVPARQVGWVGVAGIPLVASTNARTGTGTGAGTLYTCPSTGDTYRETDGTLSLVTTDQRLDSPS